MGRGRVKDESEVDPCAHLTPLLHLHRNHTKSPTPGAPPSSSPSVSSTMFPNTADTDFISHRKIKDFTETLNGTKAGRPPFSNVY